MKDLGGDVKLRDHMDRYAARTLTDGTQGSSAQSGIANARIWIEYAYRDGLEAGVRQERQRWEDKIKRIFGVEVR